MFLPPLRVLFSRLWKTGGKFLDLDLPFLGDEVDSNLIFFLAKGGSDITPSSPEGETLRRLFRDLQPQTAFPKKFL
jgi:hypothetical protein